MAKPELKSLDDYEIYLTEKMASWSPKQRIALAAAIAERWLPAYDSFSEEENWGDPASLRRSLDAVWTHVQGRELSARDTARHIQQIEEITPHMDDFDAEEALIAAAAVQEALRTSGDLENTLAYACTSALGVFEGLADSASEERVWKKGVVRKELQAQLALIEEIDKLGNLDGAAVATLRKRIVALKVKASSRPKPKLPPGITNQTLFEQYRRMVESDLKGQVKGQPEPEPDSFLFAVTYFGFWVARYSRRRQTINGSYGRFADEAAQRALVKRNRTVDSSGQDLPRWNDTMRKAIEMCCRTTAGSTCSMPAPWKHLTPTALRCAGYGSKEEESVRRIRTDGRTSVPGPAIGRRFGKSKIAARKRD
jgi:uncharacterized protein YjaG (DUF416 family)